jgi:UPF0716 protein FxsA
MAPFLIFLAFPFLELAVFSAISVRIGFWATLGLCILSAAIGSMLIRAQGIKTLLSLSGAMDRGRMPLNEVFDGFCRVAAGALLIAPGFISDALGVLLLVPAVRDLLRRQIMRHTDWAAGATWTSSTRAEPLHPDAIEGEYTRIEDGDDNPDR